MNNEERDSLLLDRIRLEHVMRVYGLNRDAVDNMLTKGSGKLRAKREKAGISLRDLAREMKCHETYLSRVERGEVSVTSRMKDRFDSALIRLKKHGSSRG